MLPRTRTGLSGLRLALNLLDIPVLYGVLVASYFLRFHTDLFPDPPAAVPELASYTGTFLLLAVAWVAFLWATGFYERIRFDLTQTFRLLGTLVMAEGFTLAAFFFRRDFSYSRLTLLLAFALAFLGLALFNLVKSWFVLALLRRGYGRAPALVVGPAGSALPCLASLAEAHDLGLDLIGYCGPPPPEPPASAPEEEPADPEFSREMSLPYVFLGRAGRIPEHELEALRERFPRLGDEDAVREVVEREGVQEIFLTYPMKDGEHLLEVLSTCEDTAAAVRVVPDLLGIITHGVQMRLVAGVPVLDMGKSPLAGIEGFLKRVIDVAGAAFGLVVLSPLFALLAFLVKRDSPGPVFYAQERVGMDGRAFTIYKFRSMPVDAEASTGPVWAAKGDPRATPLGGALRKWSLDELPQLYNVLRGDMSLVGPRPERPFFVDRFRRDIRGYMQRHKVKAGMTGWAQINGLRGQAPIEERTRYDIWYIENWSLLLDFEILIRTIWVCIVRPEG